MVRVSRALDAERYQASRGTAAAGDDDLLARLGALDELREPGFGVIDVDLLAHLSDLTDSEEREPIPAIPLHSSLWSAAAAAAAFVCARFENTKAATAVAALQTVTPWAA